MIPSAEQLKLECRLLFSRSSGPGGQNVNKVASRVQLFWNVSESNLVSAPTKARLLAAHRVNAEGELMTTSSVHRDQPKNIEACLEKILKLIERAATPPKRRRPTKPTRSSKERRLSGKKIQSKKKSTRGYRGE